MPNRSRSLSRNKQTTANKPQNATLCLTPRQRSQSARRTPRAQRKRRSVPAVFSIPGYSLLSSSIVQLTSGTFPAGSVTIPLAALSPGLRDLPWLSSFLPLFDEFRFLSLKLEWHPASGTTTNGTILMYYDPDPLAQAPNDLATASGNANLASGSARNPLSLTVPRSRLNRLPWYTVAPTRTANSTQGTVVLMWSNGSIPNVDGQTTLGTLWLQYHVQVRNPSVNAAPALANLPIQAPLEVPILNELQGQTRLQEQIQPDVAAILTRLGADVPNDVAAIATKMRVLDELLSEFRKINLNNLNQLTRALVDPADAPAMYRKDGWWRVRTGT